MKVKTYNENIVHLTFATQKELTLTMCRIGEFYESASRKLRNKKFSFEDFLDHYTDKNGNFSYLADWSGFNVPGDVLDSFFQVFDLSQREQDLKKATVKWHGKPYSVIATLASDVPTLKHELAHAHYHLNPTYRQNIATLIKAMRKDLKKQMTKKLEEWGYTSHVLNDEINAYMATSTLKYLTEDLALKVTKEDIKPFKDLAKSMSV